MLVASTFDLWRMVMYCRVQHELGQQALTQMSLEHQAMVCKLHAKLAEQADASYQEPTLEVTMEPGGAAPSEMQLEDAESECVVLSTSRAAASEGTSTPLRPRKLYRCRKCGQPRKGHTCPADATPRDVLDVARAEGALYRCRQDPSSSSHQVLLQQHIDSILMDSSDTESEDARSEREQKRASNVAGGQTDGSTRKPETAMAVKCEDFVASTTTTTPTHLKTSTPTRRQDPQCSNHISPLIQSSPFRGDMGTMAGTQTKHLAAIRACNASNAAAGEDKENWANRRRSVNARSAQHVSDARSSRQVLNGL